jgi:radical SAM superfamily enzyme YgiQ (UPF0313 family)
MGEFEESARGFIDVMKKHSDKNNRLEALAQIPGFYVPKFYAVSFNENKFNFEKKYNYAQYPINRVIVKNLDTSFYPVNWLTPHTQITHDRVPVEISRGCLNKCAFCQARQIYFPYRERKPETILKIIQQTYKTSGYEDFSLLGLSVSDYSKIENLIDQSLDFLTPRKIGLSLPSLRVDDLVGGLYKKLIPLKKISLTLAVEAARDCLRKEMNKNIDITKLFEAAAIIKSLNIQRIKLYFMFGFTQETEEDLIEIGCFLQRLAITSRLNINVSLNIFIPKPFTLWENALMDKESILLDKQQTILKNLPRQRNIKLSFSITKRSILEAIIARADRRLGKVILRAYQNGSRFEGNTENFSWPRWEAAMIAENIDYRDYIQKPIDNHPWSFIQEIVDCNRKCDSENSGK